MPKWKKDDFQGTGKTQGLPGYTDGGKDLDMFSGLGRGAKYIFNFIQKNGPVTKNDIVLFSGMKLSTLNRIMQPLEDKALVVPSSIGDSTGGRRPVLYDVNSGRHYIIGIDISRMYALVVLTDLKMRILFKRQFPMERHCSPGTTVEIISGIIMQAIEVLGISPNMILGIGVGTVGPIDREKGIILNPVNFQAEGWVNVPIAEMLGRATGYPVVIDNGANAAVLAENLFGIGRNLKSVVYFNCGIGIRTGAVFSGDLVRTINDIEDAFAHMVIDVDGEKCSCGNSGCVECYSSISSIKKAFASELRRGRTSKIKKPVDELGYIDICSAAEEGDGPAGEVIKRSAAIFGTGVANFINILNPQMVILSGPLIHQSGLFYEVCTHTALKKCYMSGDARTVFNRGGEFKENAIAVGSAVLFAENCLKDAKSKYGVKNKGLDAYTLGQGGVGAF